MSARERYYLRRRMDRIKARGEASKGTGLNLTWLHWFGLWCELQNKLCPPGSPEWEAL
jgi:hypothetical protein